MTLEKRYIIMHDYGTEGWVIVAQADTATEAVAARENYIYSGGGGETQIFEWLKPVDIYSRANR